MIQFSAKYIPALLACRAGGSDPRYYLTGIRIEPHPAGGAVLVATNGHVMMAIYDATAICTEAATLTINKDVARHCRVARPGESQATAHVNLITERLIITGGRCGDELYVQPGKCLLLSTKAVHQYPAWSRVMPNVADLSEGGRCQLQAQYLELAARAHPTRQKAGHPAPMRIWQVSAHDIVAVEYIGAPEYMLLIMPYGRDCDVPPISKVWTSALQPAPPAPAPTPAAPACEAEEPFNPPARSEGLKP